MMGSERGGDECPVCGEPYDEAIAEDGLASYDHRSLDGTRTCETIVPRDSCPKCSGAVQVESQDPLGEHCLALECDYYRAESSDGDVIHE
jgi:RNA polymerase subunit RPABC4/transcription elongation factor Spt4